MARPKRPFEELLRLEEIGDSSERMPQSLSATHQCSSDAFLPQYHQCASDALLGTTHYYLEDSGVCDLCWVGQCYPYWHHEKPQVTDQLGRDLTPACSAV